MKAVIRTLIETELDIETMTPSHAIDVSSDGDLPYNVVLLLVEGALKSGLQEVQARTSQFENGPI